MSSLSAQFERLSRPAMDTKLALDSAMKVLEATGFNCALYDYSPVARSHDGLLITPSVLELVNAPSDMAALWRDDGYYQLDPVQEAFHEPGESESGHQTCPHPERHQGHSSSQNQSQDVTSFSSESYANPHVPQ